MKLLYDLLKDRRIVPAMVLAISSFVLSGCIKMPSYKPDRKPVSPPASKLYIYPFGDEPQGTTAEITLSVNRTFDPAAVRVAIPFLKYNKTLLVMLTQDDCKQVAYCRTWAAIHGKPLSSGYYYDAPHLQQGDLPPDAVSSGKTFRSTDGAGNEVRFSFVTTLSPEEKYMNAVAAVSPGFTQNYYRFYMKSGLIWDNVAEMVNYGVGIAFHNVLTQNEQSADSIAVHYPLARQLIQDHLANRGCKMLAEPDGNKAYVTAAASYAPIRTIVLQSGGVSLRPYEVADDLTAQPIARSFFSPDQSREEVLAQMQKPVAEREAVNLGVHGTDDGPWIDFLSWLSDTYGKDGEDCVWMPGFEEYFEYNYLRRHSVIAIRHETGKIVLTVKLPGERDFYYPSLTLNVSGIGAGQCTSVTAENTVTGLSYAPYDDGVTINIDCRHALVEHATHFVEKYLSDRSVSSQADALYFVRMLKDSPVKESLLKRLQ